MAFNIFSTLKSNLNEFGGDVYDTYQTGKSAVGNAASTISKNIQDFGGDVYHAGQAVKKGVSDFSTQTYNQGKQAVQQAAKQIGSNVGNYLTEQSNQIKALPSQIESGFNKASYAAINPIMKSFTGKDNAMFSDIAPQISESLSEKHGAHDLEKVTEAVRRLQLQGLNEDQIKETLNEINLQDPNFFRTSTYADKIRQTALERGRELRKTYSDYTSGNIGFGEAAFRNAGDILGTAGGVIGNTITEIPGVEYGLQKAGQALSAIPGVKQGVQAYGEFAQANPRAAENLQAIGNIGATALGSTQGQAMIAKGVTTAGKGIKKVASPVMEKTSKLVNKVSPYIDEATMGVKKGVGNLTRSVTSTATGLEGETISLAKNKPNLFKQARTGALDRETVTGQAVDAIQSRLDELSEIGKGYDVVRKNAVVASGDDISNVYLKNAGNISTKQLTKADNSTLKDLSDYMSEYKGNVTDSDIMALRRQIDSVLYDPNTGFPRKLTPQAKQVVSGVRADIDSLAKSRIPGLAELDAKYAPEVGLLRKVKKEIFNADGTLKDNAISTISNITGKGKEAKLARLEQIMPGLGDKVSAVKAYEDVLKASGNKVGNYARGALAIGGASINPGLIAGWVATHPRVVSFMLEKYGLSKQAIKEILAKKTFSSYDTKVFSEALKKVPKSDINKFILNTKLPPILPYNYTERGTKKSSTQ